MFDFLEGRNITCGLVNFDQKKAFDRVSHRYMFRALQAFGFGPSFISWVKLLYTNVFSSVLVNGFVTAPFEVTRSVRQGCGLSPLLYVLCIEPLAHNFRINPGIRGLSLPGCNKTLKVTQYADDTTCVVVDIPSLKVILDVFGRYEKASGAALNLEKCVGLWGEGTGTVVYPLWIPPLGVWGVFLVRPWLVGWLSGSFTPCRHLRPSSGREHTI